MIIQLLEAALQFSKTQIVVATKLDKHYLFTENPNQSHKMEISAN